MYYFNPQTQDLVYVSPMGSITVMKPANAPSPEEQRFVEAIQDHKEKEKDSFVPVKRKYNKAPKAEKGKRGAITDEMLDQARELIESGMSYKNAATKVGMGVSNLYARLPKS